MGNTALQYVIWGIGPIVSTPVQRWWELGLKQHSTSDSFPVGARFCLGCHFPLNLVIIFIYTIYRCMGCIVGCFQDLISVFYRQYSSSGFIRWWPPALTVEGYSRGWRDWNESWHLQIWSHGSQWEKRWNAYYRFGMSCCPELRGVWRFLDLVQMREEGARDWQMDRCIVCSKMMVCQSVVIRAECSSESVNYFECNTVYLCFFLFLLSCILLTYSIQYWCPVFENFFKVANNIYSL